MALYTVTLQTTIDREGKNLTYIDPNNVEYTDHYFVHVSQSFTLVNSQSSLYFLKIIIHEYSNKTNDEQIIFNNAVSGTSDNNKTVRVNIVELHKNGGTNNPIKIFQLTEDDIKYIRDYIAGLTARVSDSTRVSDSINFIFNADFTTSSIVLGGNIIQLYIGTPPSQPVKQTNDDHYNHHDPDDPYGYYSGGANKYEVRLGDKKYKIYVPVMQNGERKFVTIKQAEKITLKKEKKVKK